MLVNQCLIFGKYDVSTCYTIKYYIINCYLFWSWKHCLVQASQNLGIWTPFWESATTLCRYILTHLPLPSSCLNIFLSLYLHYLPSFFSLPLLFSFPPFFWAPNITLIILLLIFPQACCIFQFSLAQSRHPFVHMNSTSLSTLKGNQRLWALHGPHSTHKEAFALHIDPVFGSHSEGVQKLCAVASVVSYFSVISLLRSDSETP